MLQRAASVPIQAARRCIVHAGGRKSYQFSAGQAGLARSKRVFRETCPGPQGVLQDQLVILGGVLTASWPAEGPWRPKTTKHLGAPCPQDPCASWRAVAFHVPAALGAPRRTRYHSPGRPRAIFHAPRAPRSTSLSSSSCFSFSSFQGIGPSTSGGARLGQSLEASPALAARGARRGQERPVLELLLLPPPRLGEPGRARKAPSSSSSHSAPLPRPGAP